MSVVAAVVGGGFMADVHTRASRSAGATVAGLASSSPARARSAADRLGIPIAYPGLDAVLDDDAVDVVHVCTPNTTHLEIALAVVRAGKHVVCEKPLATSLADARELADAARAAGVVATVPFIYRFHPLVREARSRVASGAVGALTTVHGAYLQDWLLEPEDDNWRVGESGGPSRAFADIGSHLADLLEFVAGERIVRLLAQTRTVHGTRAAHSDVDTEDLAVVLVELSGGALGTLLVSQVAPGRKNALVLEFAGATESVRFEQERPEELWIGRRRGSELLVRNPEELSADAARLSTVPAGHPMGYQDAFSGFVADSYAAIRGTTPGGLPVFDDGVRAAQITEAVLESARTSAWLEL